MEEEIVFSLDGKEYTKKDIEKMGNKYVGDSSAEERKVLYCYRWEPDMPTYEELCAHCALPILIDEDI